jgi:hypothetical protein
MEFKVGSAVRTILSTDCVLLHSRGSQVAELHRFNVTPGARAQPVTIINTLAHPSVKTAVRPGVRTFRQTVLHRIVVNVIAVLCQVGLIANGVLPEAPLPDASPAILPARTTPLLLDATTKKPRACETLLEVGPTGREIGIVCRQRPDGVQVVRQQHDGLDSKRPAPGGFLHRLPQPGSRSGLSEDRRAGFGHQGEEERPSGHERSAILGHGARVAPEWMATQEEVRIEERSAQRTLQF